MKKIIFFGLLVFIGCMLVFGYESGKFQFEAKGTLYPCLVGVPDFTPPELHGTSLNSPLTKSGLADSLRR
jgi:hypothetical protein